jgi:predicted nucleic acid-binding protein
MAYLVDTNVVVILIEPQPAVAESQQQDAARQHFEAQKAIEELKKDGENIYVTKDILNEAENVWKNKFNYSPEKIAENFEKLKNFVEELPDEREKIQQTAAAIEAKLAMENRAISNAENSDLKHAAAMKVYELTDLLTSDRKDFIKYDHFTVWKPGDVILDLKIDQIEKPLELNQLKKNGVETHTYYVTLSTGESANVYIKGLEAKEVHKEATQILYSTDVVEQIKQGTDQLYINIETINLDGEEYRLLTVDPKFPGKNFKADDVAENEALLAQIKQMETRQELKVEIQQPQVITQKI